MASETGRSSRPVNRRLKFPLPGVAPATIRSFRIVQIPTGTEAIAVVVWVDLAVGKT